MSCAEGQKVEQVTTVLSTGCRILMSETLLYNEIRLQEVSLAIGISFALNTSTSPSALRKKADDAMYRAKNESKKFKPRPSSIAADN